jgi:hypothetical protein
MKLCASILIAAFIAALTAVSAGAVKPAATAVSVRSCTVGDTPRSRSATFYSRMRAAAVPGTARMAMRFQLQDAVGDGVQDVDDPGLGRWRRSRPGVRAFGYTQKVAGLQTGGSYLVTVRYRWLDARGRVLREDTRKSGECRQRGDLPNLSVRSIKARRGNLGTAIYSIDVLNSGRAEASDVSTELFVDGAAPDEQTIASLAPGESRILHFTGPACRHRVRAVVDSRDAIHETTDDDNVIVGRCPSL